MDIKVETSEPSDIRLERREKHCGHLVRAGQNYQNVPTFCGFSVKIAPGLKTNYAVAKIVI